MTIHILLFCVLILFSFTNIFYRYRPNNDMFPIIVSQDCKHDETSNVIESYGKKLTHIMVNTHDTVLTFNTKDSNQTHHPSLYQ